MPVLAHQVLPLTGYIFETSYSTSATRANKIYHGPIKSMDQSKLLNPWVGIGTLTYSQENIWTWVYLLQVFCKESVLRTFAKFTGKHRCQSLFLNKVAGLKPATLLKKRPWHRCFPVNFAKVLRTPFLIEHLRWLLLLFIMIVKVWSYICAELAIALLKTVIVLLL